MAFLQPGQIGFDARTRESVKDEHVVAFAGEAVGDVRADEAGAARHQDRPAADDRRGP